MAQVRYMSNRPATALIIATFFSTSHGMAGGMTINSQVSVVVPSGANRAQWLIDPPRLQPSATLDQLPVVTGKRAVTSAWREVTPLRLQSSPTMTLPSGDWPSKSVLPQGKVSRAGIVPASRAYQRDGSVILEGDQETRN